MSLNKIPYGQRLNQPVQTHRKAGRVCYINHLFIMTKIEEQTERRQAKEIRGSGSTDVIAFSWKKLLWARKHLALQKASQSVHWLLQCHQLKVFPRSVLRIAEYHMPIKLVRLITEHRPYMYVVLKHPQLHSVQRNKYKQLKSQHLALTSVFP